VETVERRPWQLEDGKTNIVVALNGEDESERFGAKSLIVLGNIAKALTMFWEEDRSANILLCTHTHEDFVLLKEIIRFFPTEMLHQNIVCPGLHKANQALFFYDTYKYADLILAMRIHAMVPAIGLGTPMIALSSQKRMTEFMKEVGLTSHCLDVFEDNLSTQLYKWMQRGLKDGPMWRDKFAAARDEMRTRTKAFNQKIYDFIKEG